MKTGIRTVRGWGACLEGTGADLVGVEARFDAFDREGLDISITGLPDPVIRESRSRLSSALGECDLKLPAGRLHLNLVPAARRKKGEILDLPLALCTAAACGHLDPTLLEGALFMGELGIDGRLHAVPGGLAAALAARAEGLARVFAPPPTAREAACLPELEVHGACDLFAVLEALCGRGIETTRLDPQQILAEADRHDPEPSALDRVRGQATAKEALAVAAAGGHGLLLVGPPGTGKSLLARALPELLPRLEFEERLEVTRVLSAAGSWPGGLTRHRPFRAPHHSTSTAGLVGGGSRVRPGEITLAHRGVLFLDELPEFRREALEALRQPLETGRVLVSRASSRLEMPASVQLVCAMNPCPCGYLGHPRQPCKCPPSAIERYRRRISGPLLDRIDLRLEVPPPTLDELAPGNEQARAAGISPGMDSKTLRTRVERARAKAGARKQRGPNSALNGDDLDRLVPVTGRARALLERAANARGLSARALQSIRRVALTVHDMSDKKEGQPASEEFAQALALRHE